MTAGNEEPAGPSRARWKLWPAQLALLAFGMVELLFGPTCGLVCSRPGLGGWGAAMEAPLSACPEVEARLGVPIHFSPFFPLRVGNNFRLGNDTGGYANDGYVEQHDSISGPRSSAVYHFVAEEHGTVWQAKTAELELNGRTLDLLACGRAAAPRPSPPARASAAPSSPAAAQAELALVKGCDGGDAKLCAALASMYELGQLGPADPAQARQRWRQGCQGGDAPSCARIEGAPKP